MQRVLFAAVLVPLFAVGVGLFAAEQGKDKVKPKKSAVEGSWTAEKGGGKVTLTFAGDKFTMTKAKGDKSETAEGTFKIDTKAKPNSIDITVTGGTAPEIEKYKGKTSLGIISVDGNKMQWCANEPGKEGRPTKFADKDGDKGFLFLTLERDKK